MRDRLLHSRLIRLAHQHPEFRAELVPLLKQARGFSREDDMVLDRRTRDWDRHGWEAENLSATLYEWSNGDQTIVIQPNSVYKQFGPVEVRVNGYPYKDRFYGSAQEALEALEPVIRKGRLASERTAAGVLSIDEGIALGCAALVGGVRAKIWQARSDVFAKLGQPFVSPWGASIEGEFQNDIDPAQKGWFLFSADWNPIDKKPKVRLVMTWPRNMPKFSQEGEFDRSISRARFAQRYADWAIMQMDSYLLDVTHAYNR